MIKQTGVYLAILAFLLLLAVPLSAQIYRVVDKDGNVTYTDQPPTDGSEPMDLPELPVIQTEGDEKPYETSPALKADEEAERVLPELRKTYSDFKILQPQDQETFWGTANTVVVSWGSETPLQAGMTVKLYVDGSPRDVTGTASTTLQLDRGTHQVRAELFSGGNRPLITTPTVTFFVKQAAIGPNIISVNPDGT